MNFVGLKSWNIVCAIFVWGKQTISTLVFLDHLSAGMSSDGIHHLLLPGHGSGWMFM